MKKTSLIASLAVAGLLALPGGAIAGNDAPKNDEPKGNAYGKMDKKKVKKKINKKAKKKCKNKDGKAKKSCVKNYKRKAYGKKIKDQCGKSYGQVRKEAAALAKEKKHPSVTPSKGAKWFWMNHIDKACPVDPPAEE